MTFDYIFWDNDGVLVDTEGLYFQASREVLSEIGFELTAAQFAAVSLATGRSVFELATDDDALMEQLRRKRNRRYSELLAGTDLTLPNVRETLATLHGHYHMAIVTSSRRDHFETIHTRSGLLPFFDFILCREDYHNAKPDPEPYRLALQRSGTTPGRALVIEDSVRGLTAAKAAGIACWVIPSAQTGDQDFARADRVLGSLRQLPGLLDVPTDKFRTFV